MSQLCPEKINFLQIVSKDFLKVVQISLKLDYFALLTEYMHGWSQFWMVIILELTKNLYMRKKWQDGAIWNLPICALWYTVSQPVRSLWTDFGIIRHFFRGFLVFEFCRVHCSLFLPSFCHLFWFQKDWLYTNPLHL